MAIADPLSRLSRQEHRVDNLDLPLLLEILFTGLPEEIRNLEHFSVNAEKDTNVATRLVQRWRTTTNPISNTIGGSERTDFLIAAPYADKLPLKVAEYIRQDVPFAILVPLSLLNEIDRIGKDQVDELVCDRRSRMKLVISTSLGQVNHPSYRLDISSHSVFFTDVPECEELQRLSSAVFSSFWYTEDVAVTHDAAFSTNTLSSTDLHQLIVRSVDRLMTEGIGQEHDAFSNLTSREMRAQKRDNKRQRSVDFLDSGSTDLSQKSSKRLKNSKDQPVNLLDSMEVPEEEVTNDPSPELVIPNDECQRTTRHPLHTISSGTPPLPIERWTALQHLEDLPSNMVRVPKDELKPGTPTDLTVLRDKSGRQRILVLGANAVP